MRGEYICINISSSFLLVGKKKVRQITDKYNKKNSDHGDGDGDGDDSDDGEELKERQSMLNVKNSEDPSLWCIGEHDYKWSSSLRSAFYLLRLRCQVPAISTLPRPSCQSRVGNQQPVISTKQSAQLRSIQVRWVSQEEEDLDQEIEASSFLGPATVTNR